MRVQQKQKRVQLYVKLRQEWRWCACKAMWLTEAPPTLMDSQHSDFKPPPLPRNVLQESGNNSSNGF